VGIAGVLGFLLWLSVAGVAGQSEGDPWTAPVNLSLSGSAAESRVITDSQGTLHVMWPDNIEESFVYVHSSDQTWSEPMAVEVPFGTRAYFPDLPEDDPTPLFTPDLAAGSDGDIHAVWIDDVSDAYHSRVPGDQIESYEAWAPRTKVAAGVLTTTLSTGPDERLHVAYIQTVDTAEQPAGLYYRQSNDDGLTWSDAITITQSAYFRLLTHASANVQLAVHNQDVYVAWDDWPHEHVMVSHSADGGATWGSPQEIDRRAEEDGLDASGPSKIRIAASERGVHVTWQAGHDGLSCAQYYRWSTDGGANWQPRERLLDIVTTCPTQTQFLDNSEWLILLATTGTTRFLAVWQDSQWGVTEEQPSLNGFTDPQTFRQIDFTCGQAALIQGDQMSVFSCGLDLNQDLWFQQRTLAALADPRPTPVWQAPVVLNEGSLPFVSPVLVSDSEGRVHAFWSPLTNEADAPFGPPATEIQYAQLDSGRWSRAAAILSSPEGATLQPAAAIDNEGSILAVWSGGQNGEIYFSRASASEAALPSEWTEPQSLPIPGPGGTSPAIGVDSAGTTYVVYAVPLNDRRGIYLLKSDDSGENWAEPLKVFAGVPADSTLVTTEMIVEPRLALSGMGQLHVIWRQQPAVSSTGDTMYYVRSTDGGASWSVAEQVGSESQQDVPVLWHEIVSAGGNAVHRIWQEWELGRLNVWHQRSLDNGQVWSAPLQVAVLDAISVPATLTADSAGQLHLLLSVNPSESGGTEIVRHWIWSGEVWQEQENLVPDARTVNDVHSLGAVALDDQLEAVFSAMVEVEDEAILERLFASGRDFELPPTTPTPPPQPTATLTPIPLPSLTPTPQPTPTIDFPAAPETGTNQSSLGMFGPAGGIVIGLVAVLLLIGLLVFTRGLGLSRARRPKH
jgi:hypothetical protein